MIIFTVSCCFSVLLIILIWALMLLKNISTIERMQDGYLFIQRWCPSEGE